MGDHVGFSRQQPREEAIEARLMQDFEREAFALSQLSEQLAIARFRAAGAGKKVFVVAAEHEDTQGAAGFQKAEIGAGVGGRW
ncbi:MAG: hypothetical protein QM723_08015 [Myxococcaceae bacterium]